MRLVYCLIFLIYSGLQVVSAQYLASESYSVNTEGSEIYFEINNFGSPVKGKMPKFYITGKFSEQNLNQSKFSAKFEVSSINTENKTRDRHLQGKKWFNESAFPNIQFESKSIEKLEDGEFKSLGELSIAGIKKEIIIYFNIEEEGNQLFINGKATLNRRDFSVGGGSLFLSDEVTVFLRCPIYQSR
jgi:polyisoprenoid-binding protein YceI